MSQPKPIIIIQGANFGSEAKGAVAGELCRRLNIDYAVRTGAINAGHTVYHMGKPYAMQQLPVGWVNPDTTLIIGAGAYVAPDVLERERGWVESASRDEGREPNCLLIDYNTGIHLPEYAQKSASSDRHHAFGATGKGSSEAIKAKLDARATKGGLLFMRHESSERFRKHAADTRETLHRAYDGGMSIMLEGTQGALLDLHFGPHPFTTCRQTVAAAWVAEAGLAPGMLYRVILVARTFPIRVAGNSGPMWNEITWPMLAREINDKLQAAGEEPLVQEQSLIRFERELSGICEAYGCDSNFPAWNSEKRWEFRVALSEAHQRALQNLGPEVRADLARLFEITTVTKKLRRISRFDALALRDSVRYNRASEVVITFLNYLFPDLWNATEIPTWHEARVWLDGLEDYLGVPITYVNTGPLPDHLIARDIGEGTWLK